MSILVDTGIVLDLLDGRVEARDYLRSLDEINVSSITVHEVLSVCGNDHGSQVKTVELFFNECKVFPVNGRIAARAAQYQRRWPLKRGRADFLIEATAEEFGMRLATRHPADFMQVETVVPYTI